MPYKIEASTDDYLVATWRKVGITVYMHETTVEGVQITGRAMLDHAEAHRGEAFWLIIVEEQAPMPDAQARQDLADVLKRGTGLVKMSAVVYEGLGFRAAAVRSIVTGLLLFSKPSYPHKIFPSVAHAAGWFAAGSEGEIEAKLLLSVVDTIRRNR